MDAGYFDRWTTWLVASRPSRRGLLRLGLGSSLAALLFGQAAEEALACRRNGKPCARGNKTKQNRGCCSGTCKKGTCRPTPGAKGCQVNSGDFCKSQLVPCPNESGGLCVLLDNGKPFCITRASVCTECTSNADCTGAPGGKCVRTCARCAGNNNQGCMY